MTGSVYDSYIVSAWAKADAVADRDTEREFKVDIKIAYTDGTTLWKKASFNATVSGWQQLVFAFDLNGTGNSGKRRKVFVRIFAMKIRQMQFILMTFS